jgi:hypothetical protein
MRIFNQCVTVITITTFAVVNTAVLSSFATNDDDVPYVIPTEGPRGAICGSVTPAITPCWVIAENRDGIHGNISMLQNDGSFMITELPFGIYDLIVMPKDTAYCVLAGQYVPQEYRGTPLDNASKSIISDILRSRMPLAYRSAYINGQADVRRFCADIASDYVDRVTSGPNRGMIFSPNRTITEGASPSEFVQKRDIIIVEGNTGKAFTICFTHEETTLPFYYRRYKEGNAMKQVRVDAPKTIPSKYLEICYFNRMNGRWLLKSREPIRPRTFFTYPHVPPILDRLQIRFMFDGPFVGIEICASKPIKLATIELPRWDNR